MPLPGKAVDAFRYELKALLEEEAQSATLVLAEGLSAVLDDEGNLNIIDPRTGRQNTGGDGGRRWI